MAEGYADRARSYKSVVNAQEALKDLDMEVVGAFYISKEHTVSSRVLASAGPTLAAAPSGVPVPRVRSLPAKQVVNSVYRELPETWPLGRPQVAQQAAEKVYVSAGAEASLGRIRKAYPVPGVSRSLLPVSRGEARAAIKRCGLSMTGKLPQQLREYPLVPVEGEVGITVNPHSSNGFPVLENWSYPGAAAKCQALAVSLYEEIQRAPDVVRWLRGMEMDDVRRQFVALMGKTKSDTYKKNKVGAAELRFYNVFPRPMMLIMQKATQVLELNYQAMHDANTHSFAGRTLVRGGAAEVVALMQAQLDERGYAYIHVGDDSWVAILRDGHVCMFALDCSNFDLTQHSDVTAEVHLAFRDELRKINPKCADLWYGYARERIVVVTGSLVRRFKHAGPSGMPLQSKVNDVLMDVLIDRSMRVLKTGTLSDLDEERIERVLQREGGSMGFEVRIEQPSLEPATNMIEALEATPFLFAGYYFHIRGGQVCVCADLPRTMAQMPYPGTKWHKSALEMQQNEAMRIGSIALNLGVPPVAYEAAFEAFRHGARSLLANAIKYAGDVQDDKLRWAMQDVPHGADATPSLSGLLRALERDPAELWLKKELELFSTSELITPAFYQAWADEVEAEEERELEAAGPSAVRPPMMAGVRALPLPSGRRSTHPITFRNDGRPPPVAVWAPDRAPARQSAELFGPRKLTKGERRDGIRRREYERELLDHLNYVEEEDSDEGR